MSYQFVHLESYSRKADSKDRSTDFIFSEASRMPEASVHVSYPLPPVVVLGVSVEALQEIHDTARHAELSHDDALRRQLNRSQGLGLSR